MKMICPECGERKDIGFEQLCNEEDVVLHCLKCGCVRDIKLVQVSADFMNPSIMEQFRNRRPYQTKYAVIKRMYEEEGIWEGLMLWCKGDISSNVFAKMLGVNPTSLFRWKSHTDFRSAVEDIARKHCKTEDEADQVIDKFRTNYPLKSKTIMKKE